MHNEPTYVRGAAFERAESTLRKVRDGLTKTILTPVGFRFGHDEGVPLAAFLDFVAYSKLFKGLSNGAVLLEQERASKIGGLRTTRWDVSSYGKPSVRSKMHAMFEDRVLSFDTNALQRAVEQLKKLYQGPRLVPISVADAWDSLPRGTNMCYPTFARAVQENAVEMEAMRQKAFDLVDRRLPSSEAGSSPGLLQVRVRPSGQEFATVRGIFGCARDKNTIASTVFEPLFAAVKKMRMHAAWRNRYDVGSEIGAMLVYARDHKVPILSQDLEAFDTSVSFELIHAVFDVYRSWFVDWATPILDWVEKDFTESDLYVPPFVLWTNRKRGIPSGHKMTNIIGSHVNFLANHYAADQLGVQVVHEQYNGDDAATCYYPRVHKRDVVGCLGVLGLTMHPEKTWFSSSEVRYLQDRFSLDSLTRGVTLGIRPISQMWQMLCVLERRDQEWESWMNVYRGLQQINCCDTHPKFDKLCEWFAMHEEKFSEEMGRLGQFSKEELLRIERIINRTSGRIGIPMGRLAFSPAVTYLMSRIRGS